MDFLLLTGVVVLGITRGKLEVAFALCAINILRVHRILEHGIHFLMSVGLAAVVVNSPARRPPLTRVRRAGFLRRVAC